MKSNGRANGDGLAELQRQVAELMERVATIEMCASIRHDLPGVLGWRQRAALDAAAHEREAAERQRAVKARSARFREFLDTRCALHRTASVLVLDLEKGYAAWCDTLHVPDAERMYDRRLADYRELRSALEQVEGVSVGRIKNRRGVMQNAYLGIALAAPGESSADALARLRSDGQRESAALADRREWARVEAEVERANIEDRKAAAIVNRQKARELQEAGNA
jgi:hypothetical protein